MSIKKQTKLEMSHKIALAALLIAIIVLLFGNNICGRLRNNNPFDKNKITTTSYLHDTVLAKPRLADYLPSKMQLTDTIFIRKIFEIAAARPELYKQAIDTLGTILKIIGLPDLTYSYTLIEIAILSRKNVELGKYTINLLENVLKTPGLDRAVYLNLGDKIPSIIYLNPSLGQQTIFDLEFILKTPKLDAVVYASAGEAIMQISFLQPKLGQQAFTAVKNILETHGLNWAAYNGAINAISSMPQKLPELGSQAIIVLQAFAINCKDSTVRFSIIGIGVLATMRPELKEQAISALNEISIRNNIGSVRKDVAEYIQSIKNWKK
jgi:hypothetical protein